MPHSMPGSVRRTWLETLGKEEQNVEVFRQAEDIFGRIQERIQEQEPEPISTAFAGDQPPSRRTASTQNRI